MRLENNDDASRENVVKIFVYCSFCKKPNCDVKWVVAGPNVSICDECIDICIDILEDKGLSIRSISYEVSAKESIKLIHSLVEHLINYTLNEDGVFRDSKVKDDIIAAKDWIIQQERILLGTNEK